MVNVAAVENVCPAVVYKTRGKEHHVTFEVERLVAMAQYSNYESGH